MTERANWKEAANRNANALRAILAQLPEEQDRNLHTEHVGVPSINEGASYCGWCSGTWPCAVEQARLTNVKIKTIARNSLRLHNMAHAQDSEALASGVQWSTKTPKAKR